MTDIGLPIAHPQMINQENKLKLGEKRKYLHPQTGEVTDPTCPSHFPKWTP